MFIFFNHKLLYTLIAVSFIASFFTYPFSPSEIPIHFDVWNKPDVVVHKNIGLFVLPVLMLLILYVRKFYLEATYGIYLFFVFHIYILYIAVT